MIQEDRGANVRIEKLIKRFGEVVAVNNVSLDIEPGEFITLLGPSGSGKTTTLMMVAGFEVPDSGEIYINKEPVMFKPAYKRGIGMVFQNYSLFPHMTVERNIEFPLRMRKMRGGEKKRKILQVLELVKLAGYETRYPRQLSGGQQQRIALARALVFDPPVLLMDEPLGALDKKLREHMQLEIKQIAQSLHITVIYVTHDQSEAMTMSDRIAIMNNGIIEQLGSPIEVYDRPRNYFVADFIGESNFISGKLSGSDGKVAYFVSTKGLKSTTAANPEVETGAKVHLVIRPEKISLCDADHSYPNQFEANIEEIIYLGDITRYKARLAGDGTEIIVKEQNKYNPRLNRGGNKIQIGWSEEDCYIVKAS